MKKSKALLVVFSIILVVLAFSLLKIHSQNATFSESSYLCSVSEFEETVLTGKEYKQLTLPNCICYAAYDPSYPSIYLYILEKQEDGHYAIVVEEGGIGFTIDSGKRIATEFMFLPLQMNMIFSPTSIDPHEGYQEIAFSDAYLYTSEDYNIVYPIGGSK